MAEDRGGNDIEVKWFNKGTNLHTVWDSKMIDTFGMTYTEIAANEKELTKEELKTIQKGTIIDWMYDSRELCKNLYKTIEPGKKLRYRYSYDYMNKVLDQLQKGGIRLASLLNEIFS
jgi:hypothetical protein